MKKFFIFLFLIISITISIFPIYACSNDWKPIIKATIVTDGIEKKFTSGRSNHFGAAVVISSDEYDNKRNLKDSELLNKTLTLSQAYKNIKQGEFSYKYTEPKLEGDWYYIASDPLWTNSQYCKHVYSYTSYSFTYIKIINDTTIKIKTINGETTYTVTSYSVTELTI